MEDKSARHNACFDMVVLFRTETNHADSFHAVDLCIVSRMIDSAEGIPSSNLDNDCQAWWHADQARCRPIYSE